MRIDERGLRKSVWLSADRPSLLHRLRSVGPPGHGLFQLHAKDPGRGIDRGLRAGPHGARLHHIDDIVDGVLGAPDNPPPVRSQPILNIGHSPPLGLMELLPTLQQALGPTAQHHIPPTPPPPLPTPTPPPP